MPASSTGSICCCKGYCAEGKHQVLLDLIYSFSNQTKMGRGRTFARTLLQLRGDVRSLCPGRKCLQRSLAFHSDSCRTWPGEAPQGGWGTKPKDDIQLEHTDTHQHPPPAETHHTEPALEHEAFVVSGSYPRLECFWAADSIGFLGLPLWVVHSLHVLSQFVFPLGKEQLGRKISGSLTTRYEEEPRGELYNNLVLNEQVKLLALFTHGCFLHLGEHELIWKETVFSTCTRDNPAKSHLTLNCLPHVEHRKSLRSECRSMWSRSLSGRQKALSHSVHW